MKLSIVNVTATKNYDFDEENAENTHAAISLV
jgi:hypothetical protein